MNSREESLEHSSDEGSLQQLNDAFSEMLSSERGEVEGTGVSAASGADSASSEDDGLELRIPLRRLQV